MNGRHDRFRELCAEYQICRLDGGEFREFENLLRDMDDEMRKILADIEWTALHLPAGVEMVEVPPHVKHGLFEKIGSEGAAPESVTGLSHDRKRFLLPLVAILTAVVIGLSVLSIALYRQLEKAELRASSIQDQLDQSERRIVALEGEVERREQLLDVLKSRNVEFVVMNGLDINPSGYGKIFWDTENRVAVLQIANLPPAPGEKCYQLWVWPKEGDPVSAGVIPTTDLESPSFFRLEDFAPFEKTALKGLVIALGEVGAKTPGKEWYMGARVSF